MTDVRKILVVGGGTSTFSTGRYTTAASSTTSSRCSATTPPNCWSRSRYTAAIPRVGSLSGWPSGGFSIVSMYIRSSASGTKPAVPVAPMYTQILSSPSMRGRL